jgi:hypothetical protein
LDNGNLRNENLAKEESLIKLVSENDEVRMAFKR